MISLKSFLKEYPNCSLCNSPIKRLETNINSRASNIKILDFVCSSFNHYRIIVSHFVELHDYDKSYINFILLSVPNIEIVISPAECYIEIKGTFINLNIDSVKDISDFMLPEKDLIVKLNKILPLL